MIQEFQSKFLDESNRESVHVASATRTCSATRVDSFSPLQYRACLQGNSLLSFDAQIREFARKMF